MRRITAAVLRESAGAFCVEELDIDHPREHEVLVRIVGVGICHTDLSARDQIVPYPLPAVLGHEGAGTVESVGSAVRKVKPGDSVVLSFAHCGVCTNCHEGRPAYCVRAGALNFGGSRSSGPGTLRDGNHRSVHGSFFGQSSFASHSLCDERGVVKIPSDVPLELMGPLGCGIQTGAGAVFNVLKAVPDTSVAIFGSGAVGLAALMAAKVAGVGVRIAIDLVAGRLKLAAELGATHVIDARTGSVPEQIRALTGGGGVHYSIECTGSPSVLRQAIDALRPGGTCALVGAAERRAEASLNMSFMLNGRGLRGTVEGDSVPEVFIPELIELWRAGKFPFDRLVVEYQFSRINEAVRDAASGAVIKPVLRF